MVYTVASIYFKDNYTEEAYEEYKAAMTPVIAKYNGRYIIRTNNFSAKSELWKPDRLVVIEYDDMAAMQCCVTSEEFKAAVRLKNRIAETRSIIVEQ